LAANVADVIDLLAELISRSRSRDDVDPTYVNDKLRTLHRRPRRTVPDQSAPSRMSRRRATA